MQIHEITEGVLKGIATTGKNALKFAGQAVTRPGMDYFANKVLDAAGVPRGIARSADADQVAATIDKNNAAKAAAAQATPTTQAATSTGPDPSTIPAYQRAGKQIPGVNAPATTTDTETTPQQSKIGVGQINKIIPTLRTRDLLSVKKNVDTTLAAKQKAPAPAATTAPAAAKPTWKGPRKNLTKQQQDYIAAINARQPQSVAEQKTLSKK